MTQEQAIIRAGERRFQGLGRIGRIRNVDQVFALWSTTPLDLSLAEWVLKNWGRCDLALLLSAREPVAT